MHALSFADQMCLLDELVTALSDIDTDDGALIAEARAWTSRLDENLAWADTFLRSVDELIETLGRVESRDARANATRRASKREKYGGATRARAGRGASRRKFSRRRRRGVDDAATSTMLTRMTRMTRTASSRSREDGREGSTTSRRREKIRTAED